MSDHSPIAPSSAARRIQCPQSSTLEARFPESVESVEAREGVAAHWAVSEQLEGRLIDVGQVAPNGVVLTDEMMRGADMMFDSVAKALAPFRLSPRDCQIEARVNIPRVHAMQFGSPDCYVLIVRPGQPNLLHLWDYKFGHRQVEVFENAQLVDYIAGACEGINDMVPGVEIVATIVQPRSFSSAGPVRTWRTHLVDLRALINVSNNAAHEALGPQPRAHVGPECRDCKARHACTLLQARGFAGMDEAKRITPFVMDAPSAGLELRMLDEAITLLNARRSGLAVQVESMARNGQAVPGWAMRQGEAREGWVVPAAQVIAVGDMLGLKLAKPTEAITPNQARAAGLDPDILKQYAKRGPAGLTLVADDGSLARRVFG